MESSKKQGVLRRKKRSLRVRSRIHGTALQPRLCVVKSNKHIHVQVIDDDSHRTIVALSTASKELRSGEYGKKSKAAAKFIGETVADKLQQLGVTEVIFDRGSFKYHGILKEVADAVRSKGIQL